MLFIIDSTGRRKDAAEYVARLTSSPLMTVEIKPYKPNRSQAQNRLYWMWVHVIAEWTGYDEQEVHILFRETLLGYEPVVFRGKSCLTLKSTTELTVRQMTAYLDGVAKVAYFLNIVLPYPDDANYALAR